jgi:pentatricopeptide repeat protein
MLSYTTQYIITHSNTVASNYDFEYEYEHGKRNKPVVTNLMEENPEGSELFMEQVTREARKIRVQAIRTQMRAEEEEEDRLLRLDNNSNSRLSNRSSSSSGRGRDRDRDRDRIPSSSDDLVALGQTDPDLKQILDDMRRDDPEMVVRVDDDALLEELNAAAMPDSDDDDDDDDDEDDLHSPRDGGSSSIYADPVLQKMYDIIADTAASDFTDPFEHLPGVKGKLVMRRANSAQGCDEDVEEEEEEEAGMIQGRSTRKSRDSQHLSKTGRRHEAKKGELKEALINLLDGKPTPAALSMMSNANDDVSEKEEDEDEDEDDTIITDDKIALAWDMVEFGRAPHANYSAPLNVRRRINKARATLAFHQMLKDGHEPSSVSLDAYLSVFTEARTESDVLPVLDLYDKFGIEMSSQSYCSRVAMYVKAKDIQKAMELYGEMTQRGLVPDSTTVGLLIESATHRGLVVEALRLLEEAAEKKVTVPEKNLRILRSRCEDPYSIDRCLGAYLSSKHCTAVITAPSSSCMAGCDSSALHCRY